MFIRMRFKKVCLGPTLEKKEGGSFRYGPRKGVLAHNRSEMFELNQGKAVNRVLALQQADRQEFHVRGEYLQ
jgi:hypothetical protein